MSRLRELMEELCPNGVEYKKLGEIAHYAKTRINICNIEIHNYVGVEHLRQNKEGRIQSLSLPDSDSVIEFCTDDILIGNIRPYLKKGSSLFDMGRRKEQMFFMFVQSFTNGQIMGFGC